MNDLQKLQNTVDAFCSYIESLPNVDITEQAWGPKEVLAHLVQYHESFANQADAIITGKTASSLEGRFIDVNANAVDASRGVPIEDLVQRLRIADACLRAIAESHDATTIFLLLKSDSTPRSLAGVITMVEHHIRSHLGQLERGVGQEDNVQKLQKSVAKLEAFVACLTADQQIIIGSALRDMLAINVFRHESNLGQVEAILAGQEPQPLQGRVVDLNAQAIEASQNLAQDDLLQRLASVTSHLCDLAHLNDPDSITFVFREGTRARSLNEAIGQAETDIRRGLLKLRQLLR